MVDFALGSSQSGTGRTIMMGSTGAPRPVVASNNASKYVILTSRPTTPSQVSKILLNICHQKCINYTIVSAFFRRLVILRYAAKCFTSVSHYHGFYVV